MGRRPAQAWGTLGRGLLWLGRWHWGRREQPAQHCGAMAPGRAYHIHGPAHQDELLRDDLHHFPDLRGERRV